MPTLPVTQAAPPIQTFPDPLNQYLRRFNLYVSNLAGQAIDFSPLRCVFSVKLNTLETPNSADIRVYNVAPQTAVQVRSEFKNVIIQAGYAKNFGVIFKGNIKQVILGRENATDTFMDLVCGDGDSAYNFAVVNDAIGGSGAGATQQDVLNVCLKSMEPFGITSGAGLPLTNSPKLMRGKILLGNTRNFIRDIAQTVNCDWSIQQGALTFIPKNKTLPGQAILITSKTGMVGAPEQTNEGVNVKCLLNPLIRVGGRIQLDNSTVQLIHLSLTLAPNATTNTAVPLSSNGVYHPFALEYQGDTRGVPWYTKAICTYTEGLIGSVSNAP